MRRPLWTRDRQDVRPDEDLTEGLAAGLDLTLNVVTHVLCRDDAQLLRAMRRVRASVLGLRWGWRVSEPAPPEDPTNQTPKARTSAFLAEHWSAIEAELTRHRQAQVGALLKESRVIAQRLENPNVTKGSLDAGAVLAASRLWRRVVTHLERREDNEAEAPIDPTLWLYPAITEALGSMGKYLGAADTIRFRDEIPWWWGEAWQEAQTEHELDGSSLDHYAARLSASWNTRRRRTQERLAAVAKAEYERLVSAGIVGPGPTPEDVKQRAVQEALCGCLESIRQRRRIRFGSQGDFLRVEPGVALSHGGGPSVEDAAARARIERGVRKRLAEAELPARLHVFEDLPPEECWIQLRTVVLGAADDLLRSWASEASDDQWRDPRPREQESDLVEGLLDASPDEAIAVEERFQQERDLGYLIREATPQQRAILLAKADPELAWPPDLPALSEEERRLLAEPCRTSGDIARVIGIDERNVRNQLSRLKRKVSQA